MWDETVLSPHGNTYRSPVCRGHRSRSPRGHSGDYSGQTIATHIWKTGSILRQLTKEFLSSSLVLHPGKFSFLCLANELLCADRISRSGLASLAIHQQNQIVS